MSKIAYRVKNWSKYNQALIKRGSLTVWIEDEAIANWKSSEINSGKGRPKTYSDAAIETAITLRTLWKIPLRMAQGLLQSIFQLMKIELPVPNYSTLSRRAQNLEIDINFVPSSQPRHLVIDSTGLKVFGEGEWKMRTHGKSKRRVWRKLHLCIDANTHEIVASVLTNNNVHDSTQVKNLLPQVKIAAVYGDKAYDNINSYEPIVEAGARAVIPPRSGAALMKAKTWGTVERNRNVRERWFLGDKLWKQGRKYHRRSLVETGMYRQKQLLGDRLKSRNFSRQVTESKIRASIINKMTHLGMPASYKIP